MAGSSQVFVGVNQAPSTTLARFVPLVGFGGETPDATEGNVVSVIPCAGTFRSAGIKMGSAPGVGKSFTYTLRVNGADTALVFMVSGAALSGNFSADVAVNAGDLVCWKVVPAGTPTAVGFRMLTEFEPSTANQYAYPAGVLTATNTAPAFAPALHYRFNVQAADSNAVTRDIVALTNGTIRSFYVALGTAPGVGNNYVVILTIGGVEQASSSVTISGAATAGNATGLSIAVAQGDMIGFKIKSKAGAPGATHWAFGTVIEPATAGEFQTQGGPGGGGWGSPGGKQYWQYPFDTTLASSTDNNIFVNHLAWPILCSNLTLRLAVAPGGVTTRIWGHESSGVTLLTTTISGAGTFNSDNSNAQLAAGASVSLAHSITGAPAASSGNAAVVMKVLSPSVRLRTLVGVGL